jgi:uncharacterized protein YkwD
MRFKVFLSLSCAWFAACVSAQTADTSSLALATLNKYRAAMGLGTLAWNYTLEQTAVGHSQYLSALTDRSILSKLASDGTPEMHRQQTGRAKFTGVTLTDRTKRTGYKFGAGEQVVFNERQNSGADVVDQLMATVYHRSGLLNPAWSELGGAVDTSDAVLVLGEGSTKNRVVSDWIGTFPGNNTTVSRIAFQNEIPDPAPERAGQWLGLPISIHTVAGRRLKFDRFELCDTDHPTQPVEGRVLDHVSDMRVGENELFFLPTKPLRYGATYEVKAQIIVNLTPQNLSWRFQTPANPFSVTPKQAVIEVTPGLVQIVEIKGMQGAMGWSSNMSAPEGSVVTVNRVGSNVEVIFPSTCNAQCKATLEIKHEGPSPSVERREFIVSPAYLAAKPAVELLPKELIDAAHELQRQPSSRALAYAGENGRWLWSTSHTGISQNSANKAALDNCQNSAQQAGMRYHCKLYPLSP